MPLSTHTRNQQSNQVKKGPQNHCGKQQQVRPAKQASAQRGATFYQAN